MSAFIVGLTGGIGSGKSTVAERFASLGIAVVDTDAIAHRLCAPGGMAIKPLQEAFGTAILRPDGGLDRLTMRQRVFSDPAEKARLEATLHPLIWAESQKQIHEAPSPYALLVVPLLVESGQIARRYDRILVVDCPESLQIERVMRRNGLGREEVRAIMTSQASRAERLAIADDCIDNGEPSAALAGKVARLHQRYLDLVQKKLHAAC